MTVRTSAFALLLLFAFVGVTVGQGNNIPGVDIVVKKSPGGTHKISLPGFAVESERPVREVVINVVNEQVAGYGIEGMDELKATQIYLLNRETGERISLSTLTRIMSLKEPEQGKANRQKRN